ncbi:hypothetical protein KTH67_11690, partial [Acinetobacter lwoffii]|nr:hypothetical protein [Acinetobacter lwoffii]
FVCRLLHLKIISLKKPLQIGLCNKANSNYKRLVCIYDCLVNKKETPQKRGFLFVEVFKN